MDEKREREVQSRQVDANESKREDGRGHRPEGGVRAAARDLGINESSARRAVKINSITAEAKARAIEYGIDTQSALERIARADDQLAEVKRIEDERVEREGPARTGSPGRPGGSSLSSDPKPFPDDFIERPGTPLNGRVRRPLRRRGIDAE